MVDRHSTGEYANSKGHGFEHEIAKQLTPWYNKSVDKPLKNAFYAVPGSGSHAWAASMNVDGDVAADPTIGFKYLIECKRYEGWTIENLLLGNFKFPEWIAQTVREGINVKRVPMLVYRRNYKEAYATVPFNAKLTKLVDPYIVKTISYSSEITSQEETITTLTFGLADFLTIPFAKANNIYDGIDWSKQVVKVKVKGRKKRVDNPEHVVDNILGNLKI